MRKSLLTAGLGLFVLATAATRADARWWSAAGATCTVGDPAIQGNRYTIVAGSVQHRAVASGLITLYCAVNPGIKGMDYVYDFNHELWLPTPGCLNGYTMRQTYTDADAAGMGVSVNSQLIRMAKADGLIYTVGGASLNSNGNPAGITTPTSMTVNFDHGFDFQNFYYYVRVDLDRPAGSAVSGIFYGVAIECR